MSPELEKNKEFETAFEVYMAPQPCLPGMSEGLKNELWRLQMLLKEQSRYWHSVCHAYNNSPTAMRFHLMLEELGEVAGAVLEENMVHVAKETGDLKVVVVGSVLVWGLGEIHDETMDLIHESNMSKLVDGKPVKNAVGRIQKGPNYRPADLRPLFARFAKGNEVK